jgi:hypothetical protein
METQGDVHLFGDGYTDRASSACVSGSSPEAFAGRIDTAGADWTSADTGGVSFPGDR